MRLPTALLACLLACAVACAPARGQDGSTPVASASGSKPDTPQAIAIQDIPQRADADELYAEQVLALASNPGEDSSASLGARLDRIAQSTRTALPNRTCNASACSAVIAASGEPRSVHTWL